MQTFSLHEGANGAVWIAKISEIHKNQRIAQQRREGPLQENRPPRGEKSPGAAAPGGPAQKQSTRSPLPLKIFVLLMSVGLISTTLLGIYMAFKYNRDKRVVWGLLLTGTLLPLVLLYL